MISIVWKWWEWMHACMNENARYDSAQIVNNNKIDTNGSEINHHKRLLQDANLTLII
jgi:hypothetical protein